MTITSILTYTVFLPLLFAPIDTSQRLGAYWWTGSPIESQYTANGQWVKLDANWMAIEATQNYYDWPLTLDNNVKLLKQNGSPILMHFHKSPGWVTSISCEIPTGIYVNSFIEFVSATILRYNPNAIEIWNEPEATAEFSQSAGWCCGCVPNPLDYTKFLNTVYTEIKARYPHIIIIGGAMVQEDTEWERTFLSSGAKMDAVSFHYYQYYSFVTANLDTTGIKERIKDINNRSSVPVWITETALLCYYVNTCYDNFREQQSEWLTLVYPLPGVERIFWFSQNQVGWKNCNMLDERKDIVYPVFDNFSQLVSGIARTNSAPKSILK